MRLTSHESNLAGSWDNGTAGWDDDQDDAREASARQTGWAILDGHVPPQHPRNPAAPHWHEDRITRS